MSSEHNTISVIRIHTDAEFPEVLTQTWPNNEKGFQEAQAAMAIWLNLIFEDPDDPANDPPDLEELVAYHVAKGYYKTEGYGIYIIRSKSINHGANQGLLNVDGDIVDDPELQKRLLELMG